MSPLTILKQLGGFGPMLFGVGFLAPLIAQSLDAMAVVPPLGASSIQFGLVIGLAMGTVAKLRGAWL